MKKIYFGLLIILGLVALYFYLEPREAPETRAAFDPKNSSFLVETMPVTLANGLATNELASIPGAKITTRYFGNEAKGGLNGDGIDDYAFLITQDGGGSGTFYYAVAALSSPQGYKTTNAVLIGDRIAPQSTSIASGTQEILINYAERKAGQPMSAQPTQSTTKRLKIKAGALEQ